MRWWAYLLPLTTAACSFVFTKPPPSSGAVGAGYPAGCTRSWAAPIVDTVLAASAATAGMVLLATSIKNNIDPAEARHMLRATGIVVGGALAVGVFGLSSNVGFENVRQCRQSYGTETGR